MCVMIHRCTQSALLVTVVRIILYFKRFANLCDWFRTLYSSSFVPQISSMICNVCLLLVSRCKSSKYNDVYKIQVYITDHYIFLTTVTRYWNTGQGITWENTNFNILLLESSQSLCSCVCIYSNKPCYSLAFTWLHACITWYIQLMAWFQTLKNWNKSFKWALIT